MKLKLALLSFLVLSSVPLVSAESFRNPVRIPTPADPAIILVGDLLNNGGNDIVWLTGGSYFDNIFFGPQTTLQVLITGTDGNFYPLAPQTLPVGVTPYCQLADETGDGRPDLICTQVYRNSASLQVFPQNGAGTFGDPITTSLPSLDSAFGYWIAEIGPPADFNGDGTPDFVVANLAFGSSYALLGNGDGTFKVVKQKDKYALSVSWDQYQAMDINGDGYIDLLFSSGEVRLGDGTGQFTPVPASGFSGNGACTFGHLNGEPYIDQVCGQVSAGGVGSVGGTKLLIFRGNGDGTFSKSPVKTISYGDQSNWDNGYGTFERPIAIVDLDGGAGYYGIFAEAGDDLTLLLPGQGLNYNYPVHYAAGYSPYFSYIGSFAMQIADLNGDHIPDVIASGPNGVYVTYGLPFGLYDTAQSYELAQTIGHETIADFNGDGIPDIAVTGDQNIELSLGKGDGTFEYRTALPRGNADFSGPAAIVHGDFNGDHHQDIAAIGATYTQDGNPHIYFGHGNGTFSAPVIFSSNFQGTLISNQMLAFDFNHDGKDDLFNNDSQNFYVSLSHGDGTFKTIVTAFSDDPTAIETQVTIADVNGDGKLDAIYGTQENVMIFLGGGNGSFKTSGIKLPIPQYDGVTIQGSIALATGDFDGDGHKDIALLATPGYNTGPSGDPYGSVLFVYFGRGGGSFTAGVPIAGFNRTYASVSTADLNNDRLDDVVLTTGGNFGNGEAIGILHSVKGRKFGPEVNYFAGSQPTDLGIVDLNGDGFPDLVVGNGQPSSAANQYGNANSVTVLMNLGNATEVTGSIYTSPEPSEISSQFNISASLDPPDHSMLSGNVNFFVDGQPAGSSELSGNFASIRILKPIPVGIHTLRATWPGGGQYGAVTLTARHQIVNGYPNSTTIVSGNNPVSYLSPITFTTTVQSPSGIPRGAVAIYDGKSRIAELPLMNGSASFTAPRLPGGTHAISAEFLPGKLWASSSATVEQVITPIDAKTTLSLSSTKVYAFEPLTLSARVRGPGAMPTGTVEFDDGVASLGIKELSNGSASLTASFATAGFHGISAQYNGNQDYNLSYSQGYDLDVLSNPTETRLEATPNPATKGQSVSFSVHVTSKTASHPDPSYYVELLEDGVSIGSAPLTNGAATIKITSLAVGTHSITAMYDGDLAFSPSRSSPISVVIQKASSSKALSASPTVATANARVVNGYLVFASFATVD